MKLIGAAPAATFRRGLVAFALTTLALAGCSVDQPGRLVLNRALLVVERVASSRLVLKQARR